MTLTRSGVGGQAALKFVIPQFDRAADSADLARTHLMDGTFFDLHDEWYYYRLLNGQRVVGDDTEPVVDSTFETVEDIYRWAGSQPADALPLDLTYSGERLYAPRFYEMALRSEPRQLGVGSIVRFPDHDPAKPDHWLLELEYSDDVTPEHVAQFFARLGPVLPAEVSEHLQWVVRSPQHDDVAGAMQEGLLPYHDRVVRFSDLVPAGTVGVYSEGVTAGRLLYVGEDGAALSDATPTDIVVTEHVPDWLPQASAILTSDPQTPLAHINLLARNRGIPNASQAGIHDDAGVRQAARVRAYAIVIARGPKIQIALISKSQYAAWANRARPEPVSIPPVDLTDMAMVVDLDDLAAELSVDGVSEDEVAAWRPIIGGKSAGFLTLLTSPGLTPPPDPLAVTVRPYIEHLAPLHDLIAGAIADPALDDPRARWLALEGDADYTDQFASDADAEFAEAFLADHGEGTPLGDVLAAGGIRAMIEAHPIAPATLAQILEVLNDTYADYDVEAGVRFRSSSSVEDIEGFNGAGLYTSFTGFLQPELLADEDDHDNTIERAILRAWASYWSFEAFEERASARIDHLSGAMGLTVHARFDDDLELNNGVATFTFLPGGAPTDVVLEINAQADDVAVTNPDNDTVNLPEVIRVTRHNGELTVVRVAESSLAQDGEVVLDDAAIREVFAQTDAVANVWRDRLNASLPEPQRLQTVVLDFEFKTMGAGWPQLVTGSERYPQRLVLRQVRSLDPGLRRMSEDAVALPVPRDVLMRASLIQSVTCITDSDEPESWVEVLTDPLLAPDMGYSTEPMIIGSPVSDGECDRETYYSSDRQHLVAMIANGDAFSIIG
jgi:hypothetical protein